MVQLGELWLLVWGGPVILVAIAPVVITAGDVECPNITFVTARTDRLSHVAGTIATLLNRPHMCNTTK